MRFDFLVGLMVEVLAILIVAKLVRDALLKRRGSDVNELVTRQRSAGTAIAQAGYLIGVLLGTLGAVSVTSDNRGFLELAAYVALAGLAAIVLQLLADMVSDRLIFRGVEDRAAANLENVNLTLAVGKAAVSIATGLVLRGALSDPEIGLLGRVAWFVAGQAVMILAVLLYTRLTPYDDLAEIKRDNLAAGFPIAGILIAVGLVMEGAIAGKSIGDGGTDTSPVTAIVEFAKILGVSLVLVYLFRLITDFLMLPKVKLAKAIVEEKNVAAGVQEGVSFFLAALIVTFFLS
jgi:uncharacterized membrane protein YjfL (UPF0719 family)